MNSTPHPTYPPTLGAILRDDGTCSFRVWAPKVDQAELHLVTPQEQFLPMQPAERGYWHLELEGIEPGTRYLFRLDGGESRPDPASRWQPDGVHTPSAVVPSQFEWTDQHWQGLPLREYITYELHIGTFTQEGTFDAAIARLDDLVDLGITAVELLPINQFPGGRNWGYDGVHMSAAQNTYGGPFGLKRLVDACHRRGIAVVLDVVYNHLGPEGNYLGQFGHYFTAKYRTPWGEALNFDSYYSDDVRRFFIESALYWVGECHIDALRLDAVHAIYDSSAYPFLQELGDAVHLEGERLRRRVHLIAESSLNDSKLCRPQASGGWGLDSQWADDLHHGLRTSLTEERAGYYQDFRGFDDLVKALRDGFVYEGQFAHYRGRRHGNSGRVLPPERFVVFSQNHDQVGNRLLGERLTQLVSFEQLKLAAGVPLLSPYLPMLFMGEEYGETAPFQFFISHLDPSLVASVREGRKAEFARFQWQEEPPDPQDTATFESCKLNHDLKTQGTHAVLYRFYQELIRLRRTDPALAFPTRDRTDVTVIEPGRVCALHYWTTQHDLVVVFSVHTDELSISLPLPAGEWSVVLDSADATWNGPRNESLPGTISSSTQIQLRLPPMSLVALTRRRLTVGPTGRQTDPQGRSLSGDTV